MTAQGNTVQTTVKLSKKSNAFHQKTALKGNTSLEAREPETDMNAKRPRIDDKSTLSTGTFKYGFISNILGAWPSFARA